MNTGKTHLFFCSIYYKISKNINSKHTRWQRRSCKRFFAPPCIPAFARTKRYNFPPKPYPMRLPACSNTQNAQRYNFPPKSYPMRPPACSVAPSISTLFAFVFFVIQNRQKTPILRCIQRFSYNTQKKLLPIF